MDLKCSQEIITHRCSSNLNPTSNVPLLTSFTPVLTLVLTLILALTLLEGKYSGHRLYKEEGGGGGT